MLPPTQVRAFALLAALDALIIPALAADATSTVAAGVPIPSTSDFILRRRHSLVTLGDFAYLDGGWLWQYVHNSTSNTPVVERTSNNYTISIDLRSSWSNSSSATDIMRSIEKSAETPRFSHPTLWRDDARGVVYLWGGAAMDGNAPNPALWKLTPDGEGGGEWATVDGVENDRTFASLARTVDGYVAVVDGAGFVVSGATTAASDPNGDETATGQTPVPGVVGYNFTTGAWSNGTTAANFTSGSTAWLGGAVGVDVFANPMVVALGGEAGTLTSLDSTQLFLDFDSVRIYSPKEDRWYTQSTTGDTPPHRYAFCMTGTHSKNGTFEVFVYGGWDGTEDDLAYGDTWVLSLPGFHWFKGEEAATHATRACDVVGKGRRQVLVVSGPNKEFESKKALQDKPRDVWANGLGVFDLSTLTWSNRFDADADEYDAPDVVKEWYNQGNEANWHSEDTKQLFSRTVVAIPTTSGGGGGKSSEDGDSGNRKTRLIGGLVGGILGGTLALGVAGLVCWRRRRRQKDKDNNDKSDLSDGNNWGDKSGSLYRSDLELEAREKPREMESPWVSSTPAELAAPVAELDGLPKERQGDARVSPEEQRELLKNYTPHP